MDPKATQLRIAGTVLCVVLFLLTSACSKSQPTTNESNAAATEQNVPVADSAAPEIDPTLLDRLKRESWRGDLGGLVQRRYVRVLVSYNKTNFFYDGPQARGIAYESL